jgi:hypothetical protein
MRGGGLFLMALLVGSALQGYEATPDQELDGAGAHLVLAQGWKPGDAGTGHRIVAESSDLNCRVTVEMRHVNPFPSDLASGALQTMCGPDASPLAKANPIHSWRQKDSDPLMRQFIHSRACCLTYVYSLTNTNAGEYWEIAPFDRISLIVHATFPQFPAKESDQKRLLARLGPLLESIEPSDDAGENPFTVERPAKADKLESDHTNLADQALAEWLKTDTGLKYHPYIYRRGWTHRILDRLPPEFCGAWYKFGQDSNPMEIFRSDCWSYAGRDPELNYYDKIHAFYQGDQLVQIWLTFKVLPHGHGGGQCDRMIRLGKHGEGVENWLMLDSEAAFPGKVYTIRPEPEPPAKPPPKSAPAGAKPNP